MMFDISLSIFLSSIIVFFIFLLLAFLVQNILTYVIKKVTEKTATHVDDLILKSLRKPIYFSVVIVGAYITIEYFYPNSDISSVIKNILITSGFLIWAYAIANMIGLLLKNFESSFRSDKASVIDSDIVPFVNNLVKIGFFGIALLMILNLWGIDITPLLASAGVAGVAVAFAARDTVSNLFGGLSIFMDRPYHVGDYVYVDDKYRGVVVEIGMRSTKIRTRDNVQITVPNSVMVTQSVINETGFDPKIRVRVHVGVAYDSDLEKVESVLNRIGEDHPDVIDDPEPRVRYREFGDSSIGLEYMAYVSNPEVKGRVIHELIKDIKASFDREGINIPFPQRDVWMKGNEKQ